MATLKETAADALPGDIGRKELIARMIRVDHAGEYGAVRIYQGQMAILGKGDKKALLEHMVEHERQHLDTFGKLIGERRVRPTALLPLWRLAGYALGVGSALLGEKAAMACTVAVEETIDEHYANQVAVLGDDEKELRDTFEKFRLEELEHRDIGYEHGAEQSPFYKPLTRAIKSGSRLAIWLSERF